MTYDFRLLPELGLAVLVAIIVAVAQILVQADFEAAFEWDSFGIQLLTGGLKAGAGALLAALTKGAFTKG